MTLNFTAICLILAINGLASAAESAPARYSLDTAESVVKFETDLGQDRICGHMPVISANLSLVFGRVSNSRLSATFLLEITKLGNQSENGGGGYELTDDEASKPSDFHIQ